MKTRKPKELTGSDWPWVGQVSLGDMLLDRLDHDQWPPVTLFSGPAQLGKRTVACWLAQRDLCRKSGRRPCGQCLDCKKYISQAHPNFQLVEKSSTKPVTIERMEEALQRFRWRTTAADGRRWLVVPEIDQWNESTANAMLKFLEEPTPQTVVIATSAYPDQILPTLRSRMIEYRWHVVPRETLEAHATSQYPELSVKDRRAFISQAEGRPGRLVKLVEQPSALELRWERTEQLLRGVETGRAVVTGDITTSDLELVAVGVRDALLSANGLRPRIWSSQESFFTQIANRIGQARLLNLSQRLFQQTRYIRQHVQPSFIYHDLLF